MAPFLKKLKKKFQDFRINLFTEKTERVLEVENFEFASENLHFVCLCKIVIDQNIYISGKKKVFLTEKTFTVVVYYQMITILVSN